MSKFAALDLGRVVAAFGRHVIVESPEGERTICHPRGKKSDCVVGDWVRWQATGDEGVIEHIEPRRNLLHRQDEWKTKSFAANIDQVLVLVAGEPMFSESQLARALIAAESAGIAALVLLNKCDLPQAAAARERLAPYRAMGVAVHETAMKAAPDAARAVLAPLLAGRATLVLGPSGMGKSTLINLMVPGAAAQTGEISAALNAGRHTTTTTTWYWLDGQRESALLDSPGFQEFGLRHVEALQLPGLMPDLRAFAGGCKFYNCTHRHEPGCAVLAAVERGEISPSRWRIYGEICDELAREKW
ncbi:MAG TPA: ribosome small subunit-dependent GTPase A [Burkholderiaceae bacterium]|nr:ribosome small subunit-dependent GTPase A [Burkholderiaceae bacterium]